MRIKRVPSQFSRRNSQPLRRRNGLRGLELRIVVLLRFGSQRMAPRHRHRVGGRRGWASIMRSSDDDQHAKGGTGKIQKNVLRERYEGRSRQAKTEENVGRR